MKTKLFKQWAPLDSLDSAAIPLKIFTTPVLLSIYWMQLQQQLLRRLLLVVSKDSLKKDWNSMQMMIVLRSQLNKITKSNCQPLELKILPKTKELQQTLGANFQDKEWLVSFEKDHSVCLKMIQQRLIKEPISKNNSLTIRTTIDLWLYKLLDWLKSESVNIH